MSALPSVISGDFSDTVRQLQGERDGAANVLRTWFIRWHTEGGDKLCRAWSTVGAGSASLGPHTFCTSPLLSHGGDRLCGCRDLWKRHHHTRAILTRIPLQGLSEVRGSGVRLTPAMYLLFARQAKLGGLAYRRAVTRYISMQWCDVVSFWQVVIRGAGASPLDLLDMTRHELCGDHGLRNSYRLSVETCVSRDWVRHA